MEAALGPQGRWASGAPGGSQRGRICRVSGSRPHSPTFLTTSRSSRAGQEGHPHSCVSARQVQVRTRTDGQGVQGEGWGPRDGAGQPGPSPAPPVRTAGLPPFTLGRPVWDAGRAAGVALGTVCRLGPSGSHQKQQPARPLAPPPYPQHATPAWSQPRGAVSQRPHAGKTKAVTWLSSDCLLRMCCAFLTWNILS